MKPFNNNINHSVAYWPLEKEGVKLEALLTELDKVGLSAIELVGQENWKLLAKYGFTCSMCKYDNIDYTKGWNDPSNHKDLIDTYTHVIHEMAKYNFKNLVCFSGGRGKMSDDLGLKHCAEGLSKIMPVAEEFGVVLHMEMLSQQTRPGAMGDSTDWGVRLCKELDSRNFFLLFDVFHMQRMEGDIINTIEKYHEYIGHYHVAGVPNRMDLDDSQEINFPGVMKAILKTGYKGYVGQEHFTSNKDKIQGIIESIRICDI